ncbi:MAG: Ig-like domain-containing protein [Pseudomonadota bacterium]
MKSITNHFSFFKLSLLPLGITVFASIAYAAVPQVASYDATLKAPKCSGDLNDCQTGTLLIGRGTLGPELNASNTLYSSCPDSNSGSFHGDESLDGIQITSVDGLGFAAGKTVTVKATVWAYSSYSSDKLDIYYSPTVSSPSWRLITTITPTKAGTNVLQASFALTAGEAQQAIRAAFRYGGSATPCNTGSYNDRDDLVIPVAGGTIPADTTPPTAVFTAPIANSTVSGTVTLQVNASDNIGVARADFYDGTTFIASDTTAPYAISRNTTGTGNGAHTYRAIVFDAAGNQVITLVTVNVQQVAGDTTPPTVAIVSPFSNATVSGVTPIQVTASDNVGVINVIFYDGVNVLSNDNAAPYSINWDTANAATGTHILRAMAVDAAGNQANATITVTVQQPLPPQNAFFDSTFAGGTGFAVDLTSPPILTTGIAVDANGSIFTVGGNGFSIYKHEMNGTKDLTWNGTGLYSGGPGSTCSQPPNGSIALQPDGKLLAVGVACRSFSSPVLDTAVMRLNSNGTLDTTFGQSGYIFQHALANTDTWVTKVLFSNNMIYVVGREGNLGFVSRYDTAGTIDFGFGTSGIARIPLSGTTAVITDIKILSDGKIALSAASNQQGSYIFAAVRLLANGSIDTSFNGNGYRTIRVGTTITGLTSYTTSLAVDASGNYYLGGYAQTVANGPYQMALVKLSNTGILDTTWNGTGVYVLPVGSTDALGKAILLAPNGKVLLGGTAYQGAAIVPTLVRFTATGTLDSMFGAGGIAQQPVPGENPAIYGMAFQHSGQLVATGTGAGFKAYIMRFNP